MYIPVAAEDELFYSEGFAVRFFKSDGTEWVANFKPGVTSLCNVLELNEGQNLLVIAHGQCYLMDPDKQEPIAVFGGSYLGIFETGEGRWVLPDSTDLTIVEPDGRHWDSPRISWDGIEISSVEGSVVSGVAFDPMYDVDEWVEFSFDVDTRELVGGSYYRERENKPWWKFWQR
jgi:hypothetical protein